MVFTWKAEEVADGRRDLRGVRLQREMPGIEETHDRVRDVAFERLGPWRQEERVVLAPHRQQRRLVSAEILLERRVERDIALVVAEQVELQLGRAGPAQVEVIERVAVRRNSRRVGDAVRVLPDGRLGLEEGAQRLAVLLRCVLPISPDRVPAVAQAFLIGVAILRNDRRDPVSGCFTASRNPVGAP